MRFELDAEAAPAGRARVCNRGSGGGYRPLGRGWGLTSGGDVYQTWPKNVFPEHNVILPPRTFFSDPHGGGLWGAEGG